MSANLSSALQVSSSLFVVAEQATTSAWLAPLELVWFKTASSLSALTILGIYNLQSVQSCVSTTPPGCWHQ